MRLGPTALVLALAALAGAPLARAETAPAQTTTATTPAAEQPVDSGAYLAARVAATDSNYAEAAGWFARALAKDPQNIDMLNGAIVATMGSGDFETAATYGRRLVDLGGKSQFASLALLADEAKRGNYAAILAATANGQSTNTLFDQLVGAWSEAGEGRMTEALAAFDKAAEAKGAALFARYHKALALASVGDFEGADKILSDPALAPLKTVRRALLGHAQILSQLERPADATALLDSAFAPGQDPAVDEMRAQLEAGQPVPYAIATNPAEGVAEAFYTMAVALNGEADNSYTLIYARTAAWLRPDHTEAVLMSASLLNAEGQHDMAAATYAMVPNTAPEFYLAELGRADTLLSSDRTDAALEVLQNLARTYPKLLSVQIAYADLLRREDRFEDATKVYDSAIALVGTPTARDWPLFFSRGICHERQKRWDQAEADLRKALELSPDQPQVLNYLGYSFLELNKNLDEALDLIKRAVAAQPDSGYITDSLAWAYFRLGRYDEAVEPMEAASLMEPVDPIVTDHLGDVYWAVGRKLEAQFQWRRALSFNPEEKEAKRIRRKLEIGLDRVLADEGAAPLGKVDAAENDH